MGICEKNSHRPQDVLMYVLILFNLTAVEKCKGRGGGVIVQNVCGCEVPQSILYHTVFAGSPARAGMVALKYKRRLLIAEFGKQTTLLMPQTQSI